MNVKGVSTKTLRGKMLVTIAEELQRLEELHHRYLKYFRNFKRYKRRYKRIGELNA